MENSDRIVRSYLIIDAGFTDTNARHAIELYKSGVLSYADNHVFESMYRLPEKQLPVFMGNYDKGQLQNLNYLISEGKI